MTETVTIACKLPHGLVLQHQVKEQEREPVMGGGFKMVDRWKKVGQIVRIAGCSVPNDKPSPVTLSHGCALTFGVDKAFWEKWLSQNADYEPVQRKMIFAHERQGNAEAQAREMKSEVSGFERLDPTNLPAEFRRKGAEIKTADPR